MIFNAKLGSLRKAFKKEAEIIFITAPHKIPSEVEVCAENIDRNGVLKKKYYKNPCTNLLFI